MPKNSIMAALGQRIRHAVSGRMAALFCDQRGASAVEFALIAPVLVIGLLSMVDIGLAVTERMDLDSVLRAGAQTAMADEGRDSVLKILDAAASENFALADQTPAAASDDAVTLSADRCVCADGTGPAACSIACDGAPQTSIYYRLSATKVYDGMILPRMTFQAALQVQIR